MAVRRCRAASAGGPHVAFPPGRPWTPASPMSMQTSALPSAQPRARRRVADVSGRPVALVETVDDPIGEEYPASGEVTGRVARAHVAEVDHAARNCRLWSEDSPGASPRAATEPGLPSQAQLAASVPDLSYGVRVGNQPTIGCLLQEMCEAFAAIGQRTTSAVPGQQVRRQARAGAGRSERQRGCQLPQHRESRGRGQQVHRRPR